MARPKKQRAEGEAAKPSKTDDEKAASFVKLSEGRVSTIIDAADSLMKLANPKAYVYSDRQIATLFAVIREKIDAAEERFASPTAKAKKEKSFQFSNFDLENGD
jgi:hypothetical protein